MPTKFDSIAEKDSAPKLAELGGSHYTSFSPLLSENYLDSDGVELKGKPDFLIKRGRCFIFVDLKSGKLNFHRSRESSHEALKQEYREILHACPDFLSYSALSQALYEHSRRGQLAVLDHGFNHSVFKLRALQAKHGWQRFIVVFHKAPSKEDAARYLKVGLVFCTVKTLPQMMSTIELIQHGWHVPFVFRTRTYSFSVTSDLTSRGMTEEEVELKERKRFMDAVTADGVAEQHMKQWHTGCGNEPF